jgi:7,8-dihydropterin-6-yl-methyl-4-(beta-D-ribofuranosyl)aminobenzene 5'-phosphate synthase
MKVKGILILIAISFLNVQIGAQNYTLPENSGLSEITATNGIDSPVTIKVIYDNFAHAEGMKEDWGYSILIEGLDKVILFDLGGKPGVFKSNFNTMKIDSKKIDFLVFSHEHSDHTGGLPAFMKMEENVSVIIPTSFSENFKSMLSKNDMKTLLVKSPAAICENLYTSGEFDFEIPEQALVLNTKKGLVVMTGCSHPGIIRMLTEIKTKFNKNIYMVFGGFHLLEKSDKEMEQIISDMKALGVVKCGAAHCTGEKQIKMFKEAFGVNYFELGAGNIIVIN